MVIGGGRSFERGRYEGTELAELLPVELSAVVRRDDPAAELAFRPLVTPTGKNHPVLRLLPDELENKKLFETFPRLSGMNRVGPAKKGALELLVHPTLKSMDGTRLPLLTLGEFGKGRTMTLATDSLWRWNFQHAGQGGDVHPYNRFWSAAIAWLMGDPEMNPLTLSVDPQNPRENTSIAFNVMVQDPSFLPAKEKSFEIQVFHQKDPTKIGGAADEPVFRDEFTSGNDGKKTVNWTPTGPGVYRVEINARFGTRNLSAERIFVVDPGTTERSKIYDNEALVKLLTNYTRGKVLRFDSSPKGLDFEKPDTLLLARERERPLWDRSLILFLAVFLLGLEWSIRKRAGLP